MLTWASVMAARIQRSNLALLWLSHVAPTVQTSEKQNHGSTSSPRRSTLSLDNGASPWPTQHH